MRFKKVNKYTWNNESAVKYERKLVLVACVPEMHCNYSTKPTYS